MSNLAQAILITLGVAVGSGVGTTVAVKIALPEAPAAAADPSAQAGAPGAQPIVDENGPSAADYMAVAMACADLDRWGNTEDEAIKRRPATARIYLAAIKAAGFSFQDCKS
jgi:hypothetical protein